MKLCVNCNNFDAVGSMCEHSSNISPVTGVLRPENAEWMRMSVGPCGLEARLFKRKPVAFPDMPESGVGVVKA